MTNYDFSWNIRLKMNNELRESIVGFTLEIWGHADWAYSRMFRRFWEEASEIIIAKSFQNP